MKLTHILTAAVFSSLMGMSAQAACGGGGYHEPVRASSTTTTYAPQQYNTAAPQYNTGPSSGFDATYFHQMSGRLRLTGEQASNVIRALNEVRNVPAGSKDFDARKEFEKRLIVILNPEQLKTYHEATKVASR